jgi:hypothetical protein
LHGRARFPAEGQMGTWAIDRLDALVRGDVVLPNVTRTLRLGTSQRCCSSVPYRRACGVRHAMTQRECCDGLFACRWSPLGPRGRSLFRELSREPEHENAFWDVVCPIAPMLATGGRGSGRLVTPHSGRPDHPSWPVLHRTETVRIKSHEVPVHETGLCHVIYLSAIV